ncbi:hypothetical protein GGTG_12595 [Gaeumannomyces tritici R3-111a-1]|uniref:Uncharacterized protein n=1 Tax=Gaeumannomyces tritici (strain R3-111a-1) TaxID=644352 RepID=J3PGH0_GAET3|nr:hypothetical protein GGTG_12595 [Gaeumannomyces tritici R3-111a-1]EJT69712.1 hypothetical protein GGTG_12595 [Gaeumannomyces tritici R3-111a-1]
MAAHTIKSHPVIAPRIPVLGIFASSSIEVSSSRVRTLIRRLRYARRRGLPMKSTAGDPAGNPTTVDTIGRCPSQRSVIYLSWSFFRVYRVRVFS